MNTTTTAVLDPQCPACSDTAAVSSAHHTSEGAVRYLRCECGQWLVAVGGQVIGMPILGPADGSPEPQRGRAS